MKLSVFPAVAADAAAIAALRNAAADHLTRRYGKGHWSHQVSERGVLSGIASSRVLVARDGRSLVGTVRLATTKPWAIDVTYFVAVARPIYLLDMAVAPDSQGRGVGTRLIDEARVVAEQWPGHAIRLDAYDADAGAGGFYARCGFREVGRRTYRRTPLIYYELLLRTVAPTEPPTRRARLPRKLR